MTDSRALVPTSSGSDDSLTTVIGSFEERILDEADYLNLPTSGVVADQEKRVLVLANMRNVVRGLPEERRGTAMYLSKFMVAVGAGLLDAALNYLWDETIGELRQRIINYDLQYFFDQAATDPEKRKDLSGPEDLVKITDDELIRSAAKIGFISDLGFHQLDLVRHMRNHASAAHPNQHELTPYALMGYLETCIKEVITLPESPTMIETSTLLRNIKTATVTDLDAARYDSLFSGLRKDQAEVLAKGLFGIYVLPESSNVARDNVRAVFPKIWESLSEETKFSFGVRYARYKANLDEDQAKYARELLEAMEAASYLPEDIRVSEIDAILDRLIGVHHALNNFHNEPPLARELKEYVGDKPVPKGVEVKYVETLVEVYIGRGSGISWNANPIYESLLEGLSPEQATLALRFVTGETLSSRLLSKSPQEQMSQLLDLLEPKVISRPSRTLFDTVIKFTGGYANMYRDSRIKELRDKLDID
ncbi:hypothetical protein [Schaalia sp. JY-X159]|uniref:hypothetical protein n=1 Tax=Schaalia sp. JY-X159 TaxID=2758575 RepID=UPI00165DA1F3|nr:hypothetical protein [Schaalia sp. JY-X159]